jgi:hypothetical protein
MTEPTDRKAPGPVGRLSRRTQWGALIAGSATLAAVFTSIGLPAALLLGPMAAGIAVACGGGQLRAPRLPMLAAQTIVGCLLARSITSEIVATFIKGWPLFLSVVLAIVALSAALGWALTRLEALPGTTAVWGTAPGGASAMMLMSGAFGADARLVAFMQYLRVVLVAAIATLVARMWVGPSSPAPADAAWFAAIHWPSLAATLGIAAVGGIAGHLLRVPAGGLLLPMLIGAVFEGTGLLHITLPPWLLAVSYTFLGWGVGLGFTREILAHAARALPQLLLATVMIIGFCGLLAYILVHAAGIDPLTAYLATSPGGMDSVAIIAASSKVDVSFVMALQTVRLAIVLIVGPPLARFISQRMR